ncbi:phage holin [Nocardia wallacei]|uniref:phage holin n=1 Tax=Nocardia wallacei TaxID=480035 RepID=UPI00245583CF|nr:hypothetical protein [Nocardia wallacei]
MTTGYATPFDRWLPAEWRGRIYAFLAPLQVALVMLGLANEQVVSLWVSMATAVLGFSMAAVNATGWRRWLYGLLAPVQALLTFYGIVTDSQAAPFAALIATVLGVGVAAAKTPTAG